METNSTEKIIREGKQFKSYYVVWKLNRGNIVCNPIVWFKSYYVVWKLEDFQELINDSESLNRTMQYGN